MHRWLRIALIALTLTVGLGSALTSSTHVHALGSTSMEMAAYDNVGNIGMYCLTGTNQNGAPAHNCWTTTGWQTDFYNWWWLKNYGVTVDEYNYSGAYQGTVYQIPADGSNVYTWWCFFAASSWSGWGC